ncbi:myosin-binding protein 1-like [Benincasa hispida]|uniref:myosin-binding protein 1-like n=1 Tax=Benincasa hispida TaxID=102211 RepID=UPI0019015A42|nr:myosin-binding protein 1-like [Benincasa hispida]XP_038877643.1 myosin-binding protein 1-like [Benincasa hispida]XP_038877644.1 myosin-binding protein 1-like [Benincasa hispida]
MGTSSVEPRTERSLFTSLLSAVSEWLLICMLFVDSIFSFFITKCAQIWKLRTPCLLCSRLDHIFGSEKRGYLWKLICSKHKLELSSLVLCHAHNKLVNVHEMCESCLFSFATINQSNSETYRLLVGKMGDDPYPGIDRDPLLGGQKYDTLSQKFCSCCKELYVPRGLGQSLIQARSSGLEAEDLDVPLSSSVAHCEEDCHESSSNPLPHVQYRELKIISDTESDGNGSILGIEMANSANSKDDLTVQDVNMEPNFISLASNLTSTKLVELASAPEPLVLEPLVTPHVQHRELKITSDTESDGNGSTLRVETTNSKDDLTVQGVNTEPNVISLAGNLTSMKLVDPALAPEPLILEPLVLLDNPLPPIECGVSIGHGLDELTPKHVEVNEVFSSPTDILPPDSMAPSSNTIATPVEVVEENYVTRSEEYEMEIRGTEKAEILPTKATSEAGSEAQPVSSDAVQMAPNMLELGDAYKLAVGTRGGRQLSGKLSEQWIGKESSKVSEDLKLLLSQLSFNRLNDQSRDMSPRLSVNGDELRNFDFSSTGMQMLQKRLSLERNESGLESLDGSIVSEVEGENVVDRLKRQVEYDEKLMSSLYKELEEERNASAIAANQAMAMITRLQEEKANLHMEALQCLRMMEEQSEYDDEALQKANDLITEKDKEIQDLEAELEFYRINFPNAYTIDNLVETSVKERDIRVVHLESNQTGTIGYGNHVAGKPDIHEKVGSEGSTYNNLLLEFEDEKLNIVQCLKKLENMLYLFSNNGVKMDLSNGEYFGTEGSFPSGTNDLDLDNSKQKTPGEDAHANDDRLPSVTNSSFDKESSELDYSDRNSLLATEMADFAFLKKEVCNLNERMETLEADKNFLELTINSLRKGEEGLQFVQEIASHLRELRKIKTRS